MKNELGRSFDQATTDKAGERNIEGDRTDTQIMTLRLIGDPMNEVKWEMKS